MPDPSEQDFRRATVKLNGNLLQPVYRGLVRLDGPWVHLKDVEATEDGLQESRGGDAKWSRHDDVSFNATEVGQITWGESAAA